MPHIGHSLKFFVVLEVLKKGARQTGLIVWGFLEIL
jgi:hypothetical protein